MGGREISVHIVDMAIVGSHAHLQEAAPGSAGGQCNIYRRQHPGVHEDSATTVECRRLGQHPGVHEDSATTVECRRLGQDTWSDEDSATTVECRRLGQDTWSAGKQGTH
eukprot:365532-Chlamydomonas_euryale.AAC.4